MLHSQISQHRNGNMFHNPIKDSEAPDYHEIVRRPMDLKTIKTRIKDGVISNSDEYQREIYLMFANAAMYNRPNSDVYRMTQEVRICPLIGAWICLYFNRCWSRVKRTYEIFDKLKDLFREGNDSKMYHTVQYIFLWLDLSRILEPSTLMILYV